MLNKKWSFRIRDLPKAQWMFRPTKKLSWPIDGPLQTHCKSGKSHRKIMFVSEFAWVILGLDWLEYKIGIVTKGFFRYMVSLFFHIFPMWVFAGVIKKHYYHLFEESNNYTETQYYLRHLHPNPSNLFLLPDQNKKQRFCLLLDPWDERYIYSP